MQSDENGGVKLLVTLTRAQDSYLESEVKAGRVLSKQGEIRRLIDDQMRDMKGVIE